MYDGFNTQTDARRAAESWFDRLWFIAQVRGAWGKFRGKSRTLRFLGDIQAAAGEVPFHKQENQAIRIAQITGTQSRADRFDCDFLPLDRRNKARWVSIAAAMMQTPSPLPPIDVVQVGTDYFVGDGHHRVSAARALDKLYINANVTVWEIASD